MKTDLHIHTNCSDGSLSPEQIVERACGAGLDAIAVTDHDNANGVERAVLAARGKPLKVVAGIELSAYDRDMETHVLGLGIDYAGERFRESMSRIQALRHERNRLLLQRLAELNIALNIDDKTPLETMAEETPPRAEIAKSAKPSVLQKLHSYERSNKTEPTKKHKEEVL